MFYKKKKRKPLFSYIVLLLLSVFVYRYYSILPLYLQGHMLGLADLEQTNNLRSQTSPTLLLQKREGRFENRAMPTQNLQASDVEVQYYYQAHFGVNLQKAFVKKQGNTLQMYLPPCELLHSSIECREILQNKNNLNQGQIQSILEVYRLELDKMYAQNANLLAQTRQNAESYYKGYYGDVYNQSTEVFFIQEGSI